MSPVNPDIQKERDNASFDIEDLSNVIYGTLEERVRKERIADLVHNDPNFAMSEFLSREEKIDLRMTHAAYGVKRIKELQETNQLETQEDVAEFVANINKGSPNPFWNLHFGMFTPTIMKQSTDEQRKKWLPRALNYEIIGTYAQTELGHGTFLRGLETTAHYDSSTQEFVINSPTISSHKWWPGALGKTSNYAIVMAQLYTRGEHHGVHAFIVPLRSLEDHTSLPGVTLGDIGPKFGYNEIENGFLKFNNFRIPRDNMLMRYSKVERDGTYVKPPRAKLSYGTMTLVRTKIVLGSARALAQACTIAIRYSAVRRQSEMRPGEPEPQILEYRTQQFKLFPLLASAYAFIFVEKEMLRTYHQVTEEIGQGNFENSQELHVLSSGLKAFTSSAANSGIEVCRLSCGGHGYSLASGLPQLYADFTPSCTFEGENTVLLLQTGRYLMKCCRQAEEGKSLPSFTKYLAHGKPSTNAKSVNFNDFNELVMLYEKRAYGEVHFAYSLLREQERSGMGFVVALNQISVHLLRATNAHLHYYVLKTFVDGIAHATMHANTRKVMHDLIRLFAVDGISKFSGEFLEGNAISQSDVKHAHQLVVEILDQIRPNGVALVDAFKIRDEILRSVLGRYDGNVYENMLKWAMESPMNKTDVHPVYQKYIRPLLKHKL